VKTTEREVVPDVERQLAALHVTPPALVSAGRNRPDRPLV
jgi:hypothetical protein